MRTPRMVQIADHLWEALGRIAEETGAEREALLNQALRVYAQLHGQLAPGGFPGPGTRFSWKGPGFPWSGWPAPG